MAQAPFYRILNISIKNSNNYCLGNAVRRKAYKALEELNFLHNLVNFWQGCEDTSLNTLRTLIIVINFVG